MQQIVDTEKARLEHKMNDINLAYEGKQRASQLNESVRLRYSQYTKIIKVVIIVLVLLLVIVFSSRKFNNISQHVFEVAISIVVACGFILIFILCRDLMLRNNTNFNELDLDKQLRYTQAKNILADSSIKHDTTGNVSTTDIKYNNFIDDVNGYITKLEKIASESCVDDSCCDKGTKWNPTIKKCSIKEGFSNNGENIIYPNSSIESKNYSFI